jgi:hypothetical protein
LNLSHGGIEIVFKNNAFGFDFRFNAGGHFVSKI